MGSALVVYASTTGNTKRVAESIIQNLPQYGWQVESCQIDSRWQESTQHIDVRQFDLLCVGSPVHWSLPSPNVVEFLRHPAVDAARITPGPKCGIAFATYGGAHLGPREADACLVYLEILFEHLGFQSLEHLAIPGKSGKGLNPQYYHHDLHNRPDQRDLERVASFIKNVHQEPELAALRRSMNFN